MKRGSRAEWGVLPGLAWVPRGQCVWELGHERWGERACEGLERPSKSSHIIRGSVQSAQA